MVGENLKIPIPLLYKFTLQNFNHLTKLDSVVSGTGELPIVIGVKCGSIPDVPLFGCLIWNFGKLQLLIDMPKM